MGSVTKQYYSVRDISTILGVSKTFAYKLVSSNGFPALKIGGKYFVNQDDFAHWCKRNIGKDIVL